jgi:hypothetical protein
VFVVAHEKLLAAIYGFPKTTGVLVDNHHERSTAFFRRPVLYSIEIITADATADLKILLKIEHGSANTTEPA